MKFMQLKGFFITSALLVGAVAVVAVAVAAFCSLGLLVGWWLVPSFEVVGVEPTWWVAQLWWKMFLFTGLALALSRFAEAWVANSIVRKVVAGISEIIVLTWWLSIEIRPYLACLIAAVVTVLLMHLTEPLLDREDAAYRSKGEK